jgi:Fur family ferric uptake transcriptional regulator
MSSADADAGRTSPAQQVRLERAIQLAGFRLTPSRRAIIAQLVAHDGHLSADELADQMAEGVPPVSRMTVYRTLDLLRELGEVRPVYHRAGAASYVMMPDGAHHHFVCDRCRKVMDFDKCLADTAAEELADQLGVVVTGHVLALFGLCRECQAAISSG